MTVLAIGGCLIVLVSSIFFYSIELNRAMEDKVYTALNVVEHSLEDIKEQVRLAVIGMSGNRELIEAFINNDRDVLIELAYNLKAMISLDYCTFVGSDGNVIFRSSDPELYGDPLAHLPHISAALGGEIEDFIFSGVTIRFGLSAAAPVYSPDGEIIGVISTGRMLDSQDIAYNLKDLTGCEITIFLEDERVATTLKDESGNYVLGTRADADVKERVLFGGGQYFGRYNLFGDELLGKYTPLYGANDTIVGMLFVGFPTAAESGKIIVFTLNGVIITLVVLFACFIIARIISGVFEKQVESVMEELSESRDAAEAASIAKSTFLANMSHEIRTPMNAILGITDILMQNETIPKEFEEGLGKIYTSCNMLLGIINDILDFSKIEAGKLGIAISEYSIASLISDAVQLNIMRTESKPIEFELFASENLPSNLIGDELRIKQILNNLLSNAFKYTEAGRITLTVGFELGIGDRDVTLLISVRDTGLGMSKEQLDKLFAEYSRFTKANSTVEGTGLGLSITHRLLKLMGGEISVVSEPGNGSLFSVRLPQIKANNCVLGSEAASNLRHFRFSHHIHNKYDRMIRNPMPYGSVLVVDDVENNLYVAVGLMKPYKLRIDTAISGREAIDRVQNGNQYDIIFMDHMMPGMSGIEAAAHLRAAGFTGGIVALTANAVEGAAEMFLNNGFDDFISKPVDIRQLDLILNRLVRDKQLPEVIEAAKLQLTPAEPEKPPASKFAGEKIIGIDIEKGLRRYEDDINTYLQVLRSFSSSVLPLLDEIEETDVDRENIADFKIKAHGIKGASFNVFAELLGKKAEELEKAAGSGDLVFVKSRSASFINIARKLVGDIDAFIHAAENENPKPLKNALEGKILKKLFTACRNYDVDGVDAAMAEIEKYSYEIDTDNELCAWLRENVNMMKFKQIAERLTENLGERNVV
jgi:signal transduction histidine kinase/DNA-binding NarL/FixJ family response regulator